MVLFALVKYHFAQVRHLFAVVMYPFAVGAQLSLLSSTASLTWEAVRRRKRVNRFGFIPGAIVLPERIYVLSTFSTILTK